MLVFKVSKPGIAWPPNRFASVPGKMFRFRDRPKGQELLFDQLGEAAVGNLGRSPLACRHRLPVQVKAFANFHAHKIEPQPPNASRKRTV